MHIRGMRTSFKPWPNGNASGRKKSQVELAYTLALGGQTNSQTHWKVNASYPKKPFKCYFVRCNSLLEVKKACVDLRWVAKQGKPSVDLRANLISTKVSPSDRKSTQADEVVAKQSPK